MLWKVMMELKLEVTIHLERSGMVSVDRALMRQEIEANQIGPRVE